MDVHFLRLCVTQLHVSGHYYQAQLCGPGTQELWHFLDWTDLMHCVPMASVLHTVENLA